MNNNNNKKRKGSLQGREGSEAGEADAFHAASHAAPPEGCPPQQAQPTPRPYLLGGIQHSAFFPVTTAFSRQRAASGTSGRKRAAFVFCSENVIADPFTFTGDHDSAVTTVLHTDQLICGNISNVNCLGSENSVTWVSHATARYM